ncbi:MAG: response regulator [Anaerolineae bacterium]|nr:response regulator [Anaerolineae bacterium]
MKEQANILVVDDNKYNTRLLQSLLEGQGHQVVVANSGKQALLSATETPPDLILLDVVMPDMDGFATTRALRTLQITETVPIIMVTALNDTREKVKGFEAGADDFLSKPFNGIELLARVNSLLRIKRLHDELVEKNKLLERVLMRYVSEDVAREILNNPTENLQLGGQSCEVSVLFADIRGFTNFSERRHPAQVIELLIRIFSKLTPVVFDYRGTLDKYLGDALMAFYGAPVPSSDGPAQAVCSAWAMQKMFAQLKQENTIMEGLGLGVGICTGEAVVGNVGSERIMDYTVIGNTPNTARRLQENARAGQILIDEKTHTAIQGAFRTRKIDLMELKGYSQRIPIYEVLTDQEFAPEGERDRGNCIPTILKEYHGNDLQIRPLPPVRA